MMESVEKTNNTDFRYWFLRPKLRSIEFGRGCRQRNVPFPPYSHPIYGASTVQSVLNNGENTFLLSLVCKIICLGPPYG